MGDAEPQELPLAEALVRWVDPVLVEAVRAAERRHFPYHLHEYYSLLIRRLQLCRTDELRKPVPGLGWGSAPDTGDLSAAWRALERDLKARIEGGEFHLRGVRTKPARETVPSLLHSAWAADFEFDFHGGRLEVDGASYVAVVAVKGPVPVLLDGAAAATATARNGAIPPITLDNVRELTDEEVLLLLEDHARRVVETPGAKLIQPSKVSFGPIILRKMKFRAERGEIRSTLSAETEALAEWIKTQSPSHQTPSAESIANALRDDYWELKP